MDAELVLPIYSITKTLIACALRELSVAREKSIHEWVSDEWCPHDVTIGQLLNHTSGLRDYGALPEYQDAIRAGTIWGDRDFADHTLMQPLLFEPGTQFAYSNPGYWLLKRVVEIESGESFASALQRLIFVPLSMDKTYVATGQFSDALPHYPAEWVWHGLVMSSADDIARFLHAQEPMFFLSNLVRVDQASDPWENPHYGNGVMVEPGLWFGHNGGGPGYSASVFHFIKTRVTGCVLRTTSNSDVHAPAMHDLFNHARGIGAV